MNVQHIIGTSYSTYNEELWNQILEPYATAEEAWGSDNPLLLHWLMAASGNLDEDDFDADALRKFCLHCICDINIGGAGERKTLAGQLADTSAVNALRILSESGTGEALDGNRPKFDSIESNAGAAVYYASRLHPRPSEAMRAVIDAVCREYATNNGVAVDHDELRVEQNWMFTPGLRPIFKVLSNAIRQSFPPMGGPWRRSATGLHFVRRAVEEQS